MTRTVARPNLSRRPRSYWRVLRVLRRVMQNGGMSPFDDHGERRPSRFKGIIGRALEIMAHRRKRRGRAPLPRSLRRWRR